MMRYLSILFAALYFSVSLEALVPGPSEEIRKALERIKIQLTNHEEEIRTFEEKVRNQDATLEGLRQQVLDTHQVHKDHLKSNVTNLEARITALEAANKGAIADLKTIKDHANESATQLSQLNQKFSKLEKILDQQKENIDHLDAALKAVMDAMQVKDSSTTTSGKTYRVKSGDSLEKIAKECNCSIQSIRDLNRLSSDKIFVGQKLIVP